MSKGEPLTDADRAPWLVDVRRTALKVAESDSQDDTAGVVVACSALKVRYREVLRGKRAELDLSGWDTPGSGGLGDAHLEGKQGGSPPLSTWRTFFVHPVGSREVLLERMTTRNSHFMRADMLTSQLAALENPSGMGERDVMRIGAAESVEEQVQTALEWLTAVGATCLNAKRL
jgi:gluconokinase